MRKTWIFSIAAAAGFLLACNICGLGDIMERLQEIMEENGGITTTKTGREPDFEAFGLSLVLPEGWEMTDYRPSGGPSEMEETMGLFVNEDGLEATVTCIMAPEMFEGKTADEVAHYMVYAPEVEHPRTIDNGRISISGIRGYEATYLLEDQIPYTYRYIALASKRNSRIFAIDFTRWGRKGFSSSDKREMKRFLDGIEID